MQQFDTMCWNAPMDQIMTTVGFVLVSLVLWQIPRIKWVVYPFQVFNTFTHELAHGLAAILTGGSFRWFEVRLNCSGVAVLAGGVRFFIVSAGYMGSALAGGLVLIIAAQIQAPNLVLGVMGGALGLLCLRFVRNFFGMFSGLVLAAGMLTAAIYLPPPWPERVLLFLAVQMMLNAISSLFTLVRGSSRGLMQGSDAHLMQAMTHIPAPIWAGAWTLLALAMLVFSTGLAYCPGAMPALTRWFEQLLA